MTDDLPTPPLPDATASTRVRAVGNGFSRWPPAPGGWSRLTSAFCSASVMTARSMATESNPGTVARAACHPVAELGPAGVLLGREGNRDPEHVVVDRDRLHHLEVDDGAVQLRVLHRLESLQNG